MKQQSTIMKLLNGLSLGIVIALIPGALLGELTKALIPYFPSLASVGSMFMMSNALAGVAIGIVVGVLFQLNSIEMGALALATQIAGGAFVAQDGQIFLKGTGDVVTMGLTVSVGLGLALWLRPRVKTYAVILTPMLMVVIAGGIGRLLYPYATAVTQVLGQGIAQLLTLEQTLMAVLIAIVFAVLVVSPISSVGVALAIQIVGIGSGAANLGVCACAFGLAIAGRRVNPLGLCAAHFIGAPKVSMANVVRKPVLYVPIICNATILGVLASVFAIKGTPFSAGFGVSGLIGPINHLNQAGWTSVNIMMSVLIFFVAPITLAYIFDKIFVDHLGWIQPEDYRIELG